MKKTTFRCSIVIDAEDGDEELDCDVSYHVGRDNGFYDDRLALWCNDDPSECIVDQARIVGTNQVIVLNESEKNRVTDKFWDWRETRN